ncbi:MAG TPA: GNAT family protein [Steroidobacteraceae bacterium]|jgi:RimJ/RimL family protein N-acetyltransferase
MKPALQTSRLSFRYLTVDDFDAVHAYASDPVVTRYTAFGPNTMQQTKDFLDRVVAESALEGDQPNYQFALIEKQTNRLIGSCGLMRSNTDGPQYSFGYVLHKDWWGQGLASEATATLIQFGFDELRAHRLWAHVFLGNTASGRLLLKLGCRYEGCALKSFFARGAWHDLQTFAMLRSEWAKRVG